MTSESIHRAITARPFRPFTIRMADGQEIPVRHPENIAHVEGARIAVVMLSESQIEWIDLLLAPGLMFEESASASSEPGRNAG